MAIVMTCWGILSFILAIFLPPIGVLMHNGCGKDLIIDILLTILGYIPGIIYVPLTEHSPSASLPLLARII